MCKILHILNKVLESKYYKKQINDLSDLESKVRYKPKITAWNKEIAKLEGKLELTK